MRLGGRNLAVAVASVLALVLGLVSPMPVRAEVEFKPGMLVEGHWSSNFDRSETNEAKVYTLRLSPGIEINAYTAQSRLILNYRLNVFFHFEGGDEQRDVSEDDYVGHDARLSAFTQVGSRTTVGITDDFFLTRESAWSDRFGVPGPRDRYWRNRISPYLIYDIEERGQVKLAYRHENLDFLEGSDVASQEARGILTATYNLAETRHLDLELMGWHRWFEALFSDYTSFQAKLIYRHEFNEFLRGEVGGGWHYRNFAEDQFDDLNEFAFGASLTAEGAWTMIRLAVERNVNDFNEFDLYFRAIRASLEAERKLLEDLTARGGGYYQNSDFVDSVREDNTFYLHIGLGYKFLSEMMEAYADYGFTNRSSNEDGLDYQEHQILLGLRFVYDRKE